MTQSNGQTPRVSKWLDDSLQYDAFATSSPWFGWGNDFEAGPFADINSIGPITFQAPFDLSAVAGGPETGGAPAVPIALQNSADLTPQADPSASLTTSLPVASFAAAAPGQPDNSFSTGLLSNPVPGLNAGTALIGITSDAGVAPGGIDIVTGQSVFSGGSATAASASDLNALIKAADLAAINSGTFTINFSGSISLNTLPAVSNGESLTSSGGVGTIVSLTAVPDIAAVNLKSGVALVINGSGGATLDGKNTVRGLLAYAGSLTVNNVTLQNFVAMGGAGGNADFAGGGGAGLGGGLFVGTNARVTLNSVAFSGNQAIGGAGGDNTGGDQSGGFGGGGGMGGAGGMNFGIYVAGGGGVGRTAFGGVGSDKARPITSGTDNTANAGHGIIYGGAAGGNASATSVTGAEH
jgi:hypothetical protein